MSIALRPHPTTRSLLRYRAYAAPLLLLGLIAVYVGLVHGDLGQTRRAMLNADPRWLAVALLFQAGALSLIATNYQMLLSRLGHEVSWPRLIRAHLRRYAVATLVPFGSPASYVVFTRDLAPAGVTGTDAMSAVLLYSAGGQAAFVIFVAGAVGWLAFMADLHINSIAVAVALPITFGWVALPFLALHSGTAKIARWRFMPGRARTLMERLASHDLSPRDLLLPMCFSLVVNAMGFGMLLASLHAVGQRPSVSGLLLSRLAAQLAAHAIPVMHGAGAVEFSLVSSLTESGVGVSTATAAAMLFRMAQFWLPLTLGVLFLINAGRALRQGPMLAGRGRAAAVRLGETALVGARRTRRLAGSAQRAINGPRA